MKLRDYQNKAIGGIVESLRSHKSALVVSPTGTGKTILFAEATRMANKRCMVIAHREELLTQAAEKIEGVSGRRPDIEQSVLWANEGPFAKAKVVVASIQTLNAKMRDGRRHERFNADEFSLVIVDEAHHAVSNSYRRVLNWFHKKNPSCKILGFTATPDRSDKLALGSVFETVAFDYNIRQAIEDGWLVPVKNTSVQVKGLDFSKVRTTAGDLNRGDLASLMEFEKNLHGVAMPTLEIIGDKQTLVFASSVNHAERLAEIFDRYKPNCADFVCGATETQKRRDIIRRFKEGDTQILVNVGVATEGFDVPMVECVAMARPTKSRSLYSQMVGRGTRTQPGTVDGVDTPDLRRAAISVSSKPHCHVIDFVGNAGQHRLVHAADILGGDEPEEVQERAHKIIDSGVTDDVVEAIEIAKVEIDEEDEQRKKRSGFRATKVAYKTKSSDPFGALGIKPSSAKFLKAKRQLSGNQLAFLTRSGVDVNNYNQQEQRLLHSELVKRIKSKKCSLKQAKILNKYGFETKNMKFKEASGLLDRLAKNSWKPIS